MPQVQTVFDSVPKEDPFHIFRGSEPNYQKVVKILDFKKEDVAKASNVASSSVRYDSKMPQELQQRILEWAVAISLAGEYFGDLERTILWFHAPNALLGGISPRDMIRIGRFKKLLRFIHTAREENSKP